MRSRAAPNWSNCLVCVPANCRCSPSITASELRGRAARLRASGNDDQATKLEAIIATMGKQT